LPTDTRVVVRLIVAILVAGVLVAACAADSRTPSPSPSPLRSLGPGEQWLTVVDTHDGHVLCAGGGTIGNFRLDGSPTDPELAWMTGPDGSRHRLVWRPGFSARFAPALEVLDDHGVVVAHEGTRIVGGCAMPNGRLIELEQPGLSLSPGDSPRDGD
jgi:hypothetical protein